VRRGAALAAALLAGAAAAPAVAQVEAASLSIERGADGTRMAVVENRLAGPLQLRVWDERDPARVREATLAARATARIGPFAGTGAAELRVESQPGAPMPLPPKQRGLYAFPLPADARWQLTQGFGGRASHRDGANWFALDLAAAAGTPVLAARAGAVMQVIDGFAEGGSDASLKDRANLVRVLHADGSMGLYAHIATGSARVAVGEAVTPGRALAQVGSVGWSSAPHLHFAVQANDGRELLSLPFRMSAPDGTALGRERAN